MPSIGTDAMVMRVVSDPIAMAETDYMEVEVYQTSGANRDLVGSVITLRFAAEFLGT